MLYIAIYKDFYLAIANYPMIIQIYAKLTNDF
jgi:hypothetical protein